MGDCCSMGETALARPLLWSNIAIMEWKNNCWICRDSVLTTIEGLLQWTFDHGSGQRET
ncbi:hypothetical protein HAX54_050271, partial [Datura stramonium]|nr:hypothetical protein [Datura stramonium]